MNRIKGCLLTNEWWEPNTSVCERCTQVIREMALFWVTSVTSNDYSSSSLCFIIISSLCFICDSDQFINKPNKQRFFEITCWRKGIGMHRATPADVRRDKLGCIIYCSWREFLPCCLPQYRSVFLHISGLIYHFPLPFVYGVLSVLQEKSFLVVKAHWRKY